MKIIDIHTHTFPEKIARSAIEKLSATSHTRAFSDGTIDGLANSMNEANITLSIIQPVATKPEQVTSINNGAIRLNSQHANIISFGAIHPDFEDYACELARISKSGVKGIKLHPVYQGVNIDDERFVKILACAGELGLVVMLHAGWDIGFPGNDYAMPERILRALKSAGNVKVILAHMGGWRCWREAQELFAGRDNIYIDTAFSLGEFVPNGDGYYSSHEECIMLNDEEFVRIVKAFGAERVLFGTDSPWASQSEYIEKFCELSALSECEKNLILYENSAELLGLSR
ncbi:MAG: amidohydrolase [Synergistaceae bacterium]|nr:amidohydrolase [Synergistaceae bacterium]